MPVLHVRNVPSNLYDRLRRRAEAQRRPLNREAVALLERATEEAERHSEAALAEIRRRRFFDPAAADAPDSRTLLRRSRDQKFRAAQLRSAWAQISS
jgi:plasmid stability protein